MRTSRIGAIGFVLVLGFALLGAPAEAYEEEAGPGYGDMEVDHETTLTNNTYPQSITGIAIFPHHSIRLGLGIFSESATVNNQWQTVDIYQIYVGGSYAILPNKLSVSLDITMNALAGDQSGFTFAEFNPGVTYAFYNKRPLVLTCGLEFAMINQSYVDVGGVHALRPRPFLGAGIQAWRFFFSPYVGFPMLIDVDNGNDATPFPKRTLVNWDIVADYIQFVDYGLPVSVAVMGDFMYVTAEFSGVSEIYEEQNTTLWVTPGLLFRSGRLMSGVGVQLRVFTSYDWLDETRMWEIVGRMGVSI